MSFIDLNLYFDEENIENNIIEEPVHLFIQELELAMKIAPGELWGFRYSMDLTRYVFNQYITISKIQEEISSFIEKFCEHSTQFPFNVEVEIVEVDGEEMLYIVMEIENLTSSEKEIITQKFLLGL